MCDWPRDHYVPKFLSHLQMTTTILRHGRGTGGGGGFNVRAAPKPPVLLCKVLRCYESRWLTHGVLLAGAQGGWKLTSVPNTVSTIQRCMSGTQGRDDCT